MLPATAVSGAPEIENAMLRRLFQYWAEKKGERKAPARRDINPVEIPDLLGFVNMYDVQDDSGDYRVRLNGTEVAQMLGQEITGRLCSTIVSGEDATRCKAAFGMAVDKCVPVVVGTSLAFCGKPYMAQTVVVLPLSSDGQHIDVLLTGHSFHAIEMQEEPISLEIRRGA